MCYWVISHVCIRYFHLCSKSLIFTLNISHYTLKSPCFFPNGLVFTLNSLSGYSLQYRATHSTIICSIVMRSKGGAQYVAS